MIPIADSFIVSYYIGFSKNLCQHLALEEALPKEKVKMKKLEMDLSIL